MPQANYSNIYLSNNNLINRSNRATLAMSEDKEITQKIEDLLF